MKRLYNHLYKVPELHIINNYFNKFCNCKKGQIYIEDVDAYGEWIYCSECKIWLGWRHETDYFDINGVNIIKYIDLQNNSFFQK